MIKKCLYLVTIVARANLSRYPRIKGTPPIYIYHIRRRLQSICQTYNTVIVVLCSRILTAVLETEEKWLKKKKKIHLLIRL